MRRNASSLITCSFRRLGKKKKKTRFGSSLTSGRRGTKLKASPARTSTTGYGSASLRATTTNAATAAKRRTMISASCIVRSTIVVAGVVDPGVANDMSTGRGRRPRLQLLSLLLSLVPARGLLGARANVFPTIGRARAVARSRFVPSG